MNSHSFDGYLTADPELRHTPKGTEVASIRVGVRSEKDKPTVFVDCELWGLNAVNVSKFFKKGSPIVITDAKMIQEEWDDKTTGQKRSKIKFSVNRWDFPIGKKDGEANGNGGANGHSGGDNHTEAEVPSEAPPRRSPKSAPKEHAPSRSYPGFNTNDNEDEEIPFD